jgi:prepilin-type N-terminal cleavage/methylation domain-containing protein
MLVTRNRNKAFSLVELVIVVVIIGIIGAIAIPRLSRGAAGASDSAVKGDLTILRSAIDLFASEHSGTFPGLDTAGNVVDPVLQLTTYTDETGKTNAAKTAVYIYGPYIKAIPALPVGANKGNTGLAATAGAGVGWLYTQATGAITTSTTTEADAKGTLYNTY